MDAQCSIRKADGVPKMIPLVAIVGRPNVGKSTLFNRLIGEKKAIVLDTPGVTRDRNYGEASWRKRAFNVVDTGGFEPRAEEGVTAAMRRQALLAVDEADAVLFVTDARDGLMPADREVAAILRSAECPVLFVVNKVDSRTLEGAAAEFYKLGADEIYSVSSEHGLGVGRLLDALVGYFPKVKPEEDDARLTRVALLGRPNAGKSTLTNRLLGDDRMIVDSEPGTTRDAVDSLVTWKDKQYVFIDTAGLRRKRGIDQKSSEGYSVVRTIRAMERCHVAVCLIDANEGITEQDQRIIGMAVERGRALVIGINKWDAVEKDHKTLDDYSKEVYRMMPFVAWAPHVFISGLRGTRIAQLMRLIDESRAAHLIRISTGPLNRWLEHSTNQHHPPIHKNRRLRLYYATQARNAPPTIVVSCNDPDAIHFSYKRYLINQFREAFDVKGTPVKLVFKGKKNPYVDNEG